MYGFDALALGFGRRLPVVIQTEAAECGLVCLAMIASYHGYRADVTELRQRFSVSLKGMTLAQIMQIAQQLKLGTRALRLELNELENLSLPCLVHWEFDHFVVVKSVNGRHVDIHDPACGARRMALSDFSKKFTGIALELWPSADFQKKEAKPRIRLLGLMGKISGLRRSLGQILVLGCALQAFTLVGPFLMQWTIDNVIVSDDRGLLNTLVLAFSALLILQIVLGSARAWAMIHMSTLFSVQWRTNVFSHLLRLPSQYFEKRHLGDLVARFGSADQIQQTLTASFLSVILDGLMAITTVTLMFVFSPQLAMVVVGAMTIYAMIRCAWYTPLRDATEEQIVHAARQQTHFLETIRGIQAIKLFRHLDLRRSAWLSLFVEQMNAGIRSQKLQLFYQQANALLFGVENLVVVWLGATMVMDGEFTVGMLMAFYAYKSQFSGRVGSLIDRVFELFILRLHSERFADIALHPPEDETIQMDRESIVNLRANIEVKGLKYRYSDQEPWVLDGVDFTIAEGESVAIVGPSGGGKSTLCKVLLGILPIGQGSIRVSGQEITALGVGALRDISGSVMQDDVLFAGTLAENISFFSPDSDMVWVMECAKTAGLHDDIECMPMRYSTLVGDMGAALSGGQRQRLLLARALYKRPKILFLDEATSHLDTDCERRVNAAVRALKITCIIVAHRPETIASADRVIVLANGRVADLHSHSPSSNRYEEQLSCVD
ncbi:peptidase domain-containing ABC transporter [Comamonas thiooxydans]|uniref:peptidase domain-containing ABC transporter n=1 Tax=Comamonas thiooxydans TaxID=363952 RepID=UPI00209C6451|nr:peptidase domain-containing ABC transporter [Comamonas thiooxydans]MCO8251330.1 peptidase domain-containing ABC transporter [Comamonas thiooxydans]